jgi:hypothetical protein
MALAATDLGLGNVYIFGSVNALNLHAELVAKLNLPEGFVPVSALAVGKAAAPMQNRTFIKKIDPIIFADHRQISKTECNSVWFVVLYEKSV